MSNESSGQKFSKYGYYHVSDRLELYLPDTEIKIERIGEHAFSYYRKDSQGNISEKMVPAKSNELDLELAPIRPLNHPARRTDHVFLAFDRDIYLSENSAASIYVRCPIEIGLFLVNGTNKESLDWVTCNPSNSRFGLYGSSDTGILCKYANVSMASDVSDSVPYVEGVMKILMENTLHQGQAINKVIFPITDNLIYYDDSKAVIDGVKITLKKRAAVNIAHIQTDSLDIGWPLSPTWEDTTTNTVMEMGLE